MLYIENKCRYTKKCPKLIDIRQKPSLILAQKQPIRERQFDALERLQPILFDLCLPKKLYFN